MSWYTAYKQDVVLYGKAAGITCEYITYMYNTVWWVGTSM